jgi:hypothetical protein
MALTFLPRILNVLNHVAQAATSSTSVDPVLVDLVDVLQMPDVKSVLRQQWPRELSLDALSRRALQLNVRLVRAYYFPEDTTAGVSLVAKILRFAWGYASAGTLDTLFRFAPEHPGLFAALCNARYQLSNQEARWALQVLVGPVDQREEAEAARLSLLNALGPRRVAIQGWEAATGITLIGDEMSAIEQAAGQSLRARLPASASRAPTRLPQSRASGLPPASCWTRAR